jgi:sulfite reductase beta subunit-like hemoprotein
MNEVFAENIPRDQIGPVLQPLLEHFREARQPDERLGDFAALAARLDPRGAFRNAWLERHVLGR